MLNSRINIIIINNFVRAWGHLFIYDEETLTNLFTEIGFKNINSYKICESEDKNLQNLENTEDPKRPSKKFLQYKGSIVSNKLFLTIDCVGLYGKFFTVFILCPLNLPE